jgi:hypothetical protein
MEWAKPIMHPARRMGRFVLKIPMSRDYIDEYDQLWEVNYTDRGKFFIFKGCVLFEKYVT